MINEHEITEESNGTITVTKTCVLCGNDAKVTGLNPDDVARYIGGAFVQEVFPQLSASDREILISGSHESCFDDAFGGDES